MFANSRDVADFFGKDHKHVLAKIDEIIARAPMDRQPNFRLTLIREVVGATERTLRSYELTRDGFTLLVMGFTGPKALDFKVRYIEQFSKMEEALRNPAPALPDFSNPAIAARAWADEVEKRQQLEVHSKVTAGDVSAPNRGLLSHRPSSGSAPSFLPFIPPDSWAFRKP